MGTCTLLFYLFFFCWLKLNHGPFWQIKSWIYHTPWFFIFHFLCRVVAIFRTPTELKSLLLWRSKNNKTWKSGYNSKQKYIKKKKQLWTVFVSGSFCLLLLYEGLRNLGADRYNGKNTPISLTEKAT